MGTSMVPGAAARQQHAVRVGSLAVAFLVALLVAGCTGSSGSSNGSSSATASGGATAGDDLQSAYEQVIDQVLPSVVEVQSSTGLGSGVVYDGSGDIVTNAHVVGADTQFQVLASGASGPLPAQLVGSYPPNDLAVVRITGDHKLQPATFADSAQSRVGQIVLAMGNPLGLAATVTNGIISAIGRTVSEPTTAESPGATLSNAIQTSAAINPGNSGGALVDLDAHVVGIPTLAAVDPQAGGAAPGIGFAIPSEQVKRIADQLVASGTVTNSGRAALGVRGRTVVDESGQPSGVGVVEVTPGGPADQAGITPGDVIVAVGGTPTPSTEVLGAVLADLEVGQTVPVTVRRDTARQDVQVTLSEL